MTAAAHVTDEIIASKGFGTACVCFCGDIRVLYVVMLYAVMLVML